MSSGLLVSPTTSTLLASLIPYMIECGKEEIFVAVSKLAVNTAYHNHKEC